MQSSETVQRVRIYLGERDMLNDQPLYLAILEQLRRAGATGATVLRGVGGFGAGSRLLITSATDTARPLPIVIDWIDRAERVGRMLPLLDALLANTLVTVEEVRVYRAALRSLGPFGERTIADVVDRDVVIADSNTSVAEACRQLLERSQMLLPLLDESQRVLGVVPTQDIMLRAMNDASGTPVVPPLPLPLLTALPPAEREAILAALPQRRLTDLLDAEPRMLSTETLISQAVGAMVEWGLDVLPVIAPDGQFVGLFGVKQALHAALPQPQAPSTVRDAELPAPVRLLMQVAVPTVSVNARATEALARLLAAPDRFIVLVDNGRPAGILDESMLVAQADLPLRAAWIEARQRPPGMPVRAWESLLPTDYAADLPHSPAPTIAALATRDDAIRALLEQGLERLIVVDEDGRMAGVIGRRGLLRALAQESAG